MNSRTISRLPPSVGVGLKPEHIQTILDTQPKMGFFEVHAENYMVAGGPFHHHLKQIRESYPLSIHGVGLSIGGEGTLDEAHLERLATLIKRYQPEAFSEHLAWSSHQGTFLNDLLPALYPTRNSSPCGRLCRALFSTTYFDWFCHTFFCTSSTWYDDSNTNFCLSRCLRDAWSVGCCATLFGRSWSRSRFNRSFSLSAA